MERKYQVGAQQSAFVFAHIDVVHLAAFFVKVVEPFACADEVILPGRQATAYRNAFSLKNSLVVVLERFVFLSQNIHPKIIAGSAPHVALRD